MLMMNELKAGMIPLSLFRFLFLQISILEGLLNGNLDACMGGWIYIYLSCI